MKSVQGRTIYLAGPLTGPLFNAEAFAAATECLRRAGAEVTSPHEIRADHDGEVDAEDLAAALRRDIAALLECDLVVCLEGWEEDDDASMETLVASAVGIPTLTFAEVMYALVA